MLIQCIVSVCYENKGLTNSSVKINLLFRKSFWLPISLILIQRYHILKGPYKSFYPAIHLALSPNILLPFSCFVSSIDLNGHPLCSSTHILSKNIQFVREENRTLLHGTRNLPLPLDSDLFIDILCVKAWNSL